MVSISQRLGKFICLLGFQYNNFGKNLWTFGGAFLSIGPLLSKYDWVGASNFGLHP